MPDEASPPPAPAPSKAPSAFWPTAWLALALVAAKAAHWSAPTLTREGLSSWGRDIAASAHADVLFALGVFAVAEMALVLSARWPRSQRILYRVFVVFGVACVVYAVASIQIFAYLRSPLTYPLLYLAGDMGTMRSSLGSFLSGPLVTALVAAPILYLVGLWSTSRALPLPRTRRVLLLEVLGVLLVLAAGLRARQEAEGPWKDRDDHLIADSPHWVIAASYAHEVAGGRALSAAAAFPPEFLRDFEVSARPATRARVPAGARPKNVIFLVLESTGTRYLSLYGSPYKTTPMLQAESNHALVFDNFYCHVGMSANSMAAITLSIFPYMTWREYTLEYPTFPGTTLADLLKPKGYRTAFLHSGDLAYAGGGAFLRNRGFDDIIDAGDLGCEANTSWGCAERFLVEGLLRWIDRDCQTPFFAMAWTGQSHHPYEPSPDRPFVDFFEGAPLPSDDYDLGRYLNTLLEVDRQVGRIFDGLRERDMAGDTLVVVTGDHGEAFGDPHRTWGHGARVYEENVRVPFVMWNPRLWPKGARSQVVGSHVDVNPTVADILGLPSASSWHGRSVFDRLRPPRAYFYAANDDYLLGVREGDWKYIYNATAGRDELFNLKLDPAEQRNAAPEQRERVRRLRQRLAAWKHDVGRQLADVQRAAASPSPTAQTTGR
jgi:arylsulfatase A-like enzyme